MTGKFKRGVALSATLFIIPFANTASAQMTPSNAEVIFLVDESGSMAGEQNFLPGFVNDLDTRLTAQVAFSNYDQTRIFGGAFSTNSFQNAISGGGIIHF